MIEDKLAQVGLSPPAASKPAFAYVPVTLHDGVAYVSGQLPKIEGEVRVFGKVGREVTLDAAGEEVRICVVQGLACLKEALGDLSHLRRVLKVTGFVASAPGSPRWSMRLRNCARSFLGSAVGMPVSQSASPNCHATLRLRSNS
jgi:enamine deaminase RidA (YjgF/YER057c/UK114 family)